MSSSLQHADSDNACGQESSFAQQVKRRKRGAIMKIVLLFVAAIAVSCGMAFDSVAADAAVRQHGDIDIVGAGETKERDYARRPPPPFVDTMFFAVSVAPKLESPGKEYDVAFFRINLLAGRHRAVYAIDIGGLSNFTDYKMDGIGIAGLFNSVGESDGAIHVAGLFNFAASDFAGCQISGFYSRTEGSHCGLQVGAVNYAGSLIGVQIGMFNYAEALHGVQVGAININKNSPVQFLPLINAAF